jgi:hypothetical protein
MCSHPTQIDVQGGNINNISGDQHNVQNIIFIDSSTTEQERSQLLRNLGCVPPPPTSTPAISSQTRVFTPVYHFATGSAGGIASGLIDEIDELLADRTASTDDDRGLKDELESLRQTITFTGLAMETFYYTPLGKNLASSIRPQLEQCCVVLRELFDSMHSCRQGLFSTSIWNLWHRIWWSGCEMTGQASLRNKLSHHRILLCRCLKALDS